MSEEKSLEPIKFEEHRIRRIWDEETEQWWFAVVDVIEALTDSNKPRNYWYDLKRREKVKSGVELSAICRQFKLKAANNKNQVAARKGGRIAGNARRELEAETGKPIVSPTNYLEQSQSSQEQLSANDIDGATLP
jgi:hypothetical protein